MILCNKLFLLDDEGLTVVVPSALWWTVGDTASPEMPAAGPATTFPSSDDEDDDELLDLCRMPPPRVFDL